VASGRSLWLTYEDHVQSDPRKGYLQICDFVGLPPCSVEVPLGRTNPFPVTEVIENYDEVVRELEPTSFRWMVED